MRWSSTMVVRPAERGGYFCLLQRWGVRIHTLSTTVVDNFPHKLSGRKSESSIRRLSVLWASSPHPIFEEIRGVCPKMNIQHDQWKVKWGGKKSCLVQWVGLWKSRYNSVQTMKLWRGNTEEFPPCCPRIYVQRSLGTNNRVTSRVCKLICGVTYRRFSVCNRKYRAETRHSTITNNTVER